LGIGWPPGGAVLAVMPTRNDRDPGGERERSGHRNDPPT
jgi:hypothetical protein